MEKLKFIPFTKIEKIEIYENTSKKSLKQIVAEKTPDFAITGVFYNTSWKPTCQLKSNGEILVDDGCNYYGFRWNTPMDFSMDHVPNNSRNYKNYLACCYLIINNGQKIAKPRYNPDVKGIRGRTAIGIKDNNLVLYASKDGTSDAKTPEQLRDYLYDKGVQYLVMNDGGGKVNFYDGEFMQGSAKSQNLILVYLKKESGENVDESTENSTQIQFRLLSNNPRQKAHQAKNKTGYMQHSTGTPGAKANSFMSTWNKSGCQAETELIIDDTGIYQCLDIGIRTWHCGGSGNNTHVGCEVCEPVQTRLIETNWKNLSKDSSNNTTYAVTQLQKELDARGYSVNGIDGIFGPGLKSAVEKFQKDNGLGVDGIVGKGTLRKLQNRNGSYLKYNPAETQEYFENVYNKAVYACSRVLGKLGQKNINDNTVLSHAEGYKKGIASNHADVGHWWTLHGKTMDDFRQDVDRYISMGKLPFGNDVEEQETPKTEMEKAWDLCCDKGIFDGSNPTGNVTRRQLAVVLTRTGVVKE